VSSLPEETETEESDSRHAAASFSFTFSIIGFCACVVGIHSTVRSADYGRGALVGFFAWCGLALIALLYAIVTIRRQPGAASTCALVVALMPLLLLLVGLLGSGG
jgi:hypothetical protein